MTFDYSGEHGLSQYSNVFSKSGNFADYLPHMISIDDLGYDISDYTHAEDWMSLGVSHGAAQFTAMLAAYKYIHNNNPKKFIEMLEDIPYGNGYVEFFKKKWKIDLKSTLNSQSYQNLMKNTRKIESIFSQKHERYDIVSLLRNNYAVNINLSLNSDNFFFQREKARLIVGKVLELLTPRLRELSPVIVFEEADILAPLLKEDEYYSSGDWIRQYVLKTGRRAGCLLIFIAQDFRLADPCIWNECDLAIESTFTPPMSDRSWFKMYQKDSPSYAQFFIPDDASSQFENYPSIL